MFTEEKFNQIFSMNTPSKEEAAMRTAIARVDCGDIIRVVLKEAPRKVIFARSYSQSKNGDSLGFNDYTGRSQTSVHWDKVKSVRILYETELVRTMRWAHKEKKKKRRQKK